MTPAVSLSLERRSPLALDAHAAEKRPAPSSGGPEQKQ
jgi:hypothetical protein